MYLSLPPLDHTSRGQEMSYAHRVYPSSKRSCPTIAGPRQLMKNPMQTMSITWAGQVATPRAATGTAAVSHTSVVLLPGNKPAL